MFVSLLAFIVGVSGSLVSPPAPATTAFDLNSRTLQMIEAWRFRDGDGNLWAGPAFPDSDWPVVDPNRLDHLEAGVHWMRAVVVLSGEQDPLDVLVLRFSKLPGAFEVYWDGSRVGTNGRVGRSLEDEVTGRVATMVKLPRTATPPGRHLLAVRFSNFRMVGRFRGFWSLVAYHSDWSQTRASDLHLQYFYLGIYFISTFVGISLFLGGGRHRAFLFFATYCLFITLYLAINPIQEVVNFNIQSFQILFKFADFVFFSTGILLNVFFISLFKIPHKAVHIALVISIPLVIELAKLRGLLGVDWRTSTSGLSLYSLGLVAYAVKRRRPGSLMALVGTLTLAGPRLYEGVRAVFRFLPIPDERILRPLSLLFIPCLILSISRQIREQNRLMEAARTRSLRLETQLLKSQVQPHFISNTLHSIRSWFRENPQKADKMIQALSDEFRIISAHSSKNLIPLAEEIRLCRNHLEIMGSRRDVQFELAEENIPAEDMIPPLVLHTLIENGITHAFGPRESGRFWLRYEADGGEVVYTLKNDGSRLKEWTEKSPAELEEGMGLAYVRARLEESFSGQWSLDYGLKGDVWDVTIRVNKGKLR